MADQESSSNIDGAQCSVALERKLAFLRQPSNYPEPTDTVEAIETHMSWVFLTARHAYKLKKPVRYELLDFSSLAARELYCDEELRLNCRLAPGVYLGKIPLTLDGEGRLGIGGSGAVCDWLVKMHRLPVESMLDSRIARGTANEDDAQRIMATLAAFYAACLPLPVAPDNYLEKIATALSKSMDILRSGRYPLSVREIDALEAQQEHALDSLRPVLRARATAGRLIEGHGDLRPEHVCLREPVAIIDCLEFSLNLRTLDMLDEVAFLALECERLGAEGFAHALLAAYRSRMQDDAPAALVHFYQSYRALMRAKLAIRHLDEEEFRLSPKWIARTKDYLALAASHARQACTIPESS